MLVPLESRGVVVREWEIGTVVFGDGVIGVGGRTNRLAF